MDQYTSDGKHKMIVQGDYAGSVSEVFFEVTNANPALDIDGSRVENSISYDTDNAAVTVNAKGTATFVLSDVSGNAIMDKTVSGKEIIRLGRALKGVYLVQLRTGHDCLCQKIVIR